MTDERQNDDFAALVQSMKDAGDLQEIERAVNIRKTLRDEQKIQKEIDTQERDYRLRRKAIWVSLVVPLASLITVALTVYIQSGQLQTERDKAEDQCWIEITHLLAKPPTEAFSNPALGTELGTFFSSSRHGPQAIRIAIDSIDQIKDYDLFIDLYKRMFDKAKWENIGVVVEMNVRATRKMNGLIGQCIAAGQKLAKVSLQQWYSWCSEAQSDTARLNGYSADTGKLKAIAEEMRTITQRIIFLSREIAPVIREHFSSTNLVGGQQALNLREVSLYFTALSNVDFTNLDIEEATFKSVDLKGAVLTPRVANGNPSYYDEIDFIESRWWEAKAIDHTLLKQLVEERKSLKEHPMPGPRNRTDILSDGVLGTH